MALRLSRAFGSTLELCMNLQKNFDLWEAENSSSDWKQARPFSEKVLHPVTLFPGFPPGG